VRQTLATEATANGLNHRQRIVRIGLVMLWMSCGLRPVMTHAAGTPMEIVQKTTDAVLAVLADKSLASDQKRHKIEDIVYDHFDFHTLSRLVLARNWRRLTPEQQNEFVEEFKRHLSLTYGRNVETYHNERATITGDRQEPGGDWTVKTKIIRPNASDILVDYRLRQEQGTWKVIDVIIEGVSLVLNYRSQFQEIVSNEGPAKLIELLKEKNAKGEPLKTSRRDDPGPHRYGRTS
jgi:phospholipid transport system substrate-binding protein